jgi:hypothetical protein
MKTISTTALLIAAFVLAACAPMTIGRIQADPMRYQGREVKVSGTVVNSVGILGTGGYQIEDHTGKIYVISSTGVPSKGARVTVTGSVMSGAQMLGRSVGTAIRERRHKVKY